MTDEERNRIEAFDRVSQFAIDNAADFATGVPHTQITKINTERALLDGYTVDQAEGSGLAAGAYESQDTALHRHSGFKFRTVRPGNRMIPEFDVPLKPNGQIMNGLHFLTLEA